MPESPYSIALKALEERWTGQATPEEVVGWIFDALEAANDTLTPRTPAGNDGAPVTWVAQVHEHRARDADRSATRLTSCAWPAMPDPSTAPHGQSRSLTPTMKRHLRELQDVAQESTYGEAFWHPTGGEWRTAIALSDRGFLHREYGSGMGGVAFSLTNAGRQVAV